MNKYDFGFWVVLLLPPLITVPIGILTDHLWIIIIGVFLLPIALWLSDKAFEEDIKE